MVVALDASSEGTRGTAQALGVRRWWGGRHGGPGAGGALSGLFVGRNRREHFRRGNADHLLLLVEHAGINRAAAWSMLKPRWPDIMLRDIGSAEPSPWLTVKDAAALARRRRGVKPIRVVIAAQGGLTPLEGPWDDEAMPFVF